MATWMLSEARDPLTTTEKSISGPIPTERGLNWETSIIDDNLLTAPIRVIPTDIDGDGNQDILVQRAGPDGHLVWYENPESVRLEPFDGWTEHFIGYKSPQDLCAADINGDGWMDVVNVANNSQPGYKTDFFLGEPWTEPETIGLNALHLPTALFGSHTQSCAADVDNDGDLDVIAADWTEWVSWFENTDGTGHSWVDSCSFTDPIVSGTSIVVFDVDLGWRCRRYSGPVP